MKRMIGQTPERIEVTDKVIHMVFQSGDAAWFYHYQYCCEDVHIEDVVGSFKDLIGHPLLVAEARQGEVTDTELGDEQWTFYTFRNIGGTVDVRWHGSSNGYYSVSVTYAYQVKGEREPRMGFRFS